MKIIKRTTLINIFFSRMALILLTIILVVAVQVQIINRPVYADQYDDKIASLQSDIAIYQAEGARLNAEANTLSVALEQIANQKAAVQTQVDINQVKYDQLTVQISDTEINIKNNQDALGKIIADLYVDDNITPIEMLAGSSNISDFMDKQEYRNSVRDELKSTIGKVKTLRATLESQKTEVANILTNQKSQRDTLAVKENDQQSLISKTKGDEAAYQQLISSSTSQIAEAKATQVLLNSRIRGSGGFTLIDGGSLGDYPWNGSNCPMWSYFSTGGADGSGGDGHGYGCRQCASYVAWRFAKETNLYPSWGNAVDFTASAIAAGYQEGAAQAGSIAVMDPGKAGQSYGHVAWVEAVNGDGTITISQYNFDYGAGYGMYSLMILSVNAFDHYIHIK